MSGRLYLFCSLQKKQQPDMRVSFVLIGLCCLMANLHGQTAGNVNFIESEIVLKTPNGNLYGTLTAPQASAGTPVVLIIPGSGATTRDGNAPGGMKPNTYKMLAEDLASKGISTVRFDKRGVGQSRPSATSESDLRFEIYIYDVVAWMDLLRADKRFTKVILLGHTEGALIGMCAAQQTKADGLISVAAVAQPADVVLREQLKGKLPDSLEIESNRILDSLKAGKTVAKVGKTLSSLYRPSVQPYLISSIKYNPAKEITKLSIPVLLVQGTSDLQVSSQQVKLLAAAKPDAKVLILQNMNHILKESANDYPSNVATYTNSTLPLKSGLVDGLAGFIKGLK
jgi:alpha-beta hydrolase superfamily lysophospholipase